MSKSIIQEKKECYVGKSTLWLECHHIFEGTANRRLSEKYGLKIYLCHRHHNELPDGIHYDPFLRDRVKQTAQKIFMEYYHKTKEEFIEIFGKSYI